MSTEPAQPIVRRVKPLPRPARVQRVQPLSPSMVRITVAGEPPDWFILKGPGGHIRVFFPPPGADAPPLPTAGPGGAEWLSGQRPVSRAYTPRRWNPETAELDIDFVLHGDGPGASWASRAKPGHTVLVGAQSTPYLPDPTADWHLLVGDETAQPAIGTILEQLPASSRAEVLIEVRDAASEQPLESPAHLNVSWLHRDPDPAAAGRALVHAVRTARLPEGNGRVFVGCEAVAMRDIRRHLIEERGLDRGALYTQGYWKLDAANHPDHDTGDDT